MDSDEIITKNIKIAETLTRNIALGALVITLVLVIDRVAICSFYHIPITYSSLDPVSVIPAIGIIYPVIIFLGILGSWLYSTYSVFKEEIFKIVISRKKVLYNKPTGKSNGKIRNNRKTHKSTDGKKVKREKRYDYKKWIHNLVSLYKQTYHSLESLGSSIGIRGVVIFGFITIISLIVLDVTIKASNRVEFRSTFVKGIIKICVISLSLMIFSGKVFLNSVKRKYENTQKHCDENMEGEESVPRTDIKEAEPFLKTKVIFFCVTVLMVLFSVITVYETVRLTMRNWYYTIELKDDEGINNTYIVALDLDDYYVLKRIVNNDSGFTIDTNEYVYKEKDNIRVSQEYYPSLYVGETISLDDIIEAINKIQADLELEFDSKQETNEHLKQEMNDLKQELNELLDQYVEMLEELKK